MTKSFFLIKVLIKLVRFILFRFALIVTPLENFETSPGFNINCCKYVAVPRNKLSL